MVFKFNALESVFHAIELNNPLKVTRKHIKVAIANTRLHKTWLHFALENKKNAINHSFGKVGIKRTGTHRERPAALP